ncbi:AAA family ATPase [Micromonospora matsumotoense]|uniref:AAA family ATPase n=1 Tax=Micromonospora matsumotoense TaxID=121616 RepID=UPI00341BEF41
MTVDVDRAVMPRLSFSEAECDIFARYPERVRWDKSTVPPVDQEAFRRVRKKLSNLARWAAQRTTSKSPLKDFVSTLQPNGRTPEDMWCCVYPYNAPNKSYALQLALIISEDGAELCLCLGSGTSQLRQTETRQDGEQYLQILQSRLRSTPEHIVKAVTKALPNDVRYLSGWRRPLGGSEFSGLKEWLSYAGSSEGTQASVSRYFSVNELEVLGDGITDAYLDMLQAAVPLFDYCSANGNPGEDEKLDEDVPTAALDLHTLRSRASAEPYGLQISDDVYRAVIAAVQSGKHLILTGPPGTAKTTLAEVLCQLAADAGWCRGYTLTTATADWTTYETIGGLRPAGNGLELQFHPGLCLESAADGCWLIVDELNRSNFDRAFGQLFTVLSGQSVVLPYEDHKTGERIVLAVDGGTRKHRGGGYSVIEVPRNWRIVATMNVFDKTLLFEMSYALMRRFAFVEVPAPETAVYETIWQRELAGLPDAEAKQIARILTGLERLRTIKQVGPAMFKDMARFAREYLVIGGTVPEGALAFQLFYSFLLPQFEGIDERSGRRLFQTLTPIVGSAQRERLATALREVLGMTMLMDADGEFTEDL